VSYYAEKKRTSAGAHPYRYTLVGKI
jgi:hypothetical protein